MTPTDTRLAPTPLAAHRLGLKLVRVVISVYEQADMPAEREYHIEVCEAPVRGRAFCWRRLDQDTRHSYGEVRRAMAYYLRHLSHTVVECETTYEIHAAA